MSGSKINLIAAGSLLMIGVVTGLSRTADGDDAENTRRAAAAKALHEIGQAIIQYQNDFNTTKPAVSDVNPATQPAAAPTTAPVVATVESVLAGVDAAYAKLRSAAFDGKITGHFEVGDTVRSDEDAFHTSFTAPNKFRHDAADLLIGSDGSKLYSFLKDRSVYQQMTPPKTRAASADWPAAAVQLLQDQDPSLLLAITPSAAAELKAMSAKITLKQAEDGPTLCFAGADSKPAVEMTFDPKTMLLTRAVYDFKQEMTKAGTADVKAATVTVTYPMIAVDAAVDSQQFVWVAPGDAAQVSTSTVAIDTGGAAGFGDLLGKPAPDFTLKDLAGNPVRLSSMKGSVVVLDLWATWCGPCKASLPDLDKMNQDLGPKGLKFYAIDLQEDQQTIEKLLKQTGWKFPVLLDSDGAVAKKFNCNGIPQTMVIGKDGTLKKVFVGMGQDKAIEALVKAEMGR